MVVAAITETHNYMICTGAQYGCISIGDIYVFLYIWKDDLTTLYYYRTEPEAGVEQKISTAQAKSRLLGNCFSGSDLIKQ